MYRGIYIGGHDLRDYGAKLQTDYAISGYDVTNTVNQGFNRSNVLLLRQSFAPLHISLPLDFYGKDKTETMAQLAAFAASLTGTFEVDLGDGYQYTCILEELGATAWISDEVCSVDVSMSGFRHTDPLHIESTGWTLRLANPSTWERVACKITIHDIQLRSGGGTVYVSLFQGDNSNDFLQYKIDPSMLDGALSDTLVLDGLTMHNTYKGGPIPAGKMAWTDYPYLLPGRCMIVVRNANCKIDVDFTPTYL